MLAIRKGSHVRLPFNGWQGIVLSLSSNGDVCVNWHNTPRGDMTSWHFVRALELM